MATRNLSAVSTKVYRTCPQTKHNLEDGQIISPLGAYSHGYFPAAKLCGCNVLPPPATTRKRANIGVDGPRIELFSKLEHWQEAGEYDIHAV